MSEPLTALLNNASEGSAISCTLSPESVQLIFFALSFVESLEAWKADYFDEISDSEAQAILELQENLTNELLP